MPKVNMKKVLSHGFNMPFKTVRIDRFPKSRRLPMPFITNPVYEQITSKKPLDTEGLQCHRHPGSEHSTIAECMTIVI